MIVCPICLSCPDLRTSTYGVFRCWCQRLTVSDMSVPGYIKWCFCQSTDESSIRLHIFSWDDGLILEFDGCTVPVNAEDRDGVVDSAIRFATACEVLES